MKGFVPKRLTFSDEVMEMINGFRKAGSFRSISQTVEELVRRVHYIKESGTIESVNIHLKRFGVEVKEG